MHRLLERQLKRHFGDLAAVPRDLMGFLAVVDATYTDSDADRALTERSLELASQELLQSNQNLRAAYDALKLVDRERTQFLNNAAHELSTPLTPIKLQIHMMRKRGNHEPDRDGRTMEILERNFDRLGHLVKDLLDSARIQSDHLRMDMREVDLAQVLRDAVETYTGLAKERNVSLVLEDVAALPVLGDGGRLRQVVDNLMSNALKFTPGGGRVVVSCSLDGANAVVGVADTGRGIRPEDAGRLFKPFSQVHDRMEVSEPGTGLGLYISRSILHSHGGTIWAESKGLGEGTTFRFRIPLRKETPKGTPPPGSPHRIS
ncbi:MAG TPA: HAMP domain-containing sensor histidine kinase [Candidatus Thermoplasmatota archaeon]|nr:HAMP domain-containing sensor histidine kinase [Candidatus Thermoplasmatota archaeon]